MSEDSLSPQGSGIGMVEYSEDCYVLRLGEVDYQAAWDIQRKLAAARARGRIEDTLLLLEHPHTYTLGRSGHAENLLLDEAERARLNIRVYEVDRGGDITYHGPGQLVAYPIRYLGKADPDGRLARADYIGYLRELEAVLIRTVGEFGIAARREEGYTGVWVDTPEGRQKIAAIGVRVDAHGISTHGASLNVAPDLSYFAGIIPCGITDRMVTSMQALLGNAVPSMEQVMDAFSMVFADVFGYRRMIPQKLADLLPALETKEAP